MNSSLTLHVHGGSANGSIVAAEIIPLRKGRRTRSVALKLGSTETISGVADGRYVVRLRLPNGGLVAKNIEVMEGKGQGEFYLDSIFSPNETAAWGYLLHPGRRALSTSALKSLGSQFKAPQTTASIQVLSTLESAAFEPAAEARSIPIEQPSASILRHWFKADLYLQMADSQPLRQPGSLLRLAPAGTEYVLERLSGLYSATNDPNVVAEFECHFPAGTVPVLAIDDSPVTQAEASKFPLQTFAFLPPETTRLLVIFDPTQKQVCEVASPWNLMPEFNDRHAMVLYSYLSGGHFNQARVIADEYLSHAIRALEGKFRNLSAALIGGYYLLLMTPPWTRKRSRIAGVTAVELTQWVDNLDQYFKHLADGAIINASQHLRCGRLPQARERFLAAIQRGMPCCTLGARMLMDGLKLLIEDEKGNRDAEVESAVNAIRPLYASIDWKSPFTTVRGQLFSNADGTVLKPAVLVAQQK
ncbi:MAG: hypothetical protein JWM59_35 [Verrucomicrobiales bacterium]|nr:hypothetical protein [Verrucomicrobiales bacterium]